MEHIPSRGGGVYAETCDMEQLAEPIRNELRRRLDRTRETGSFPLDRTAFRVEARRRLAADAP